MLNDQDLLKNKWICLLPVQCQMHQGWEFLYEKEQNLVQMAEGDMTANPPIFI